jgi:hypothetical protein
MISRDRFSLLVGLLISLAALMLLASGLSALELRDAQPFAPPISRDTPSQQDQQSGQLPAEASPLSPAVGLLMMLLVGMSLIFFLLSSEFRKQVLKRLRWLIGLMAILLILVYALRDQALSGFILEGGSPGIDERQFSGEFPAEPAYWISILLTFIISLTILYLFWHTYQNSRKNDTLEQLGISAEAALSALHSGVGYRSAVLRCYAEMQKTVREQHGLERKTSLTPREFQSALCEIGLPTGAVGELTRLFEAARYGSSDSSIEENDRAHACLQEISRAARLSPAGQKVGRIR